MDEIIAGVFKFIVRAIGQIFVEIIFEFLIKGPGYFILKFFSKSKANEPTENKLIIVGILFWCLILSGTYIVLKYVR